MTPERWQQIKQVFHAALEHESAERTTFLARACADDGQLRHEVESLLASHEQAESFIETPASDVAAGLLAEDQPGLVAGQMVGHFRVAGVLATGGMGQVYLADDTRLGRKVALKLLPPQFTMSADRVRRFGQEARAAAALNHPNIVTIHEIGQTDSFHFIATEFVDGETLREHMVNTRMTMGEVLDVATQVASALQAAHEAGIVHRDVKPENVMLRRDGIVKVLDFGLAKLAPHQAVLAQQASTKSVVKTNPGVIMGTVGYMSPEQAKGEVVDERTDIFSFGVVVYEMLAGRTPFAGDSMSETFANLINAEAQPLSRFAANVPVELQRIVSKTLRKNADERYQTMKDVLTDLKDVRENLTLDEKLEKSHSPENGNATTILPATTGDANKQTAETRHGFSRTIEQHKPLVAFVVVALLIGAIGLGYYFFYAGKTASGADGKKSIAVLPLKPINTANRNEIYEIGIADSLIHRLSSMKGFVVRPLSATRKYADIEQDSLAAGREQQADYVLASNYQLAGGKIRVTSQLFNVASGQIEETYKSEKDAGDIFAMQDAIAGEVGNILSSRFAATSSSPVAKRGTTNEEAYRLYLQGMYLVEKMGFANAKRAIELFDQALSLDPYYAKAWAGKARAHCYFSHVGGNSPDAEYAKAKPAIERAFALDINLAEAYAVLGVIRTDYDWDFADGEKQFLRAIEIAPTSEIGHRWYARRLAGRGRSEEAIARIKVAIDLNPSSVFDQITYGHILYFARRYDDAITQLQRVIEMDSAGPYVYDILWRSYYMKGDYPRAYESFMKFQQLIGTKDEMLRSYETSYGKSGWQGILLRYLEILKANDASGSDAYNIAVLLALLDEREQSFRYLNDAAKNRAAQISYIVGDPGLDLLRDDPRFDELLRRVGLK